MITTILLSVYCIVCLISLLVRAYQELDIGNILSWEVRKLFPFTLLILFSPIVYPVLEITYQIRMYKDRKNSKVSK